MPTIQTFEVAAEDARYIANLNTAQITEITFRLPDAFQRETAP